MDKGFAWPPFAFALLACPCGLYMEPAAAVALLTCVDLAGAEEEADEAFKFPANHVGMYSPLTIVPCDLGVPVPIPFMLEAAAGGAVIEALERDNFGDDAVVLNGDGTPCGVSLEMSVGLLACCCCSEERLMELDVAVVEAAAPR